MIVTFYATLRPLVGSRTADFNLPEGTTVRELINEMIRSYPVLDHELLDDSGQLYQHIKIFMNGRDVVFLEQGLETPLAKDEKLGIFPAIGGG
jgi:sulfur-carrier protein